MLAQLVEQRTFNPFVVGSTPAHPTKLKNLNVFIKGLPSEAFVIFGSKNFFADKKYSVARSKSAAWRMG